ncbi:MAG: glycosyltransferase [Bacteroidales bacterium]|jgi:glycosyltransferase involved in cell wall biosynthesis|nr:glycosyltransferase [Bacteroidales bacterium]MBR6271953.1 glycosyltransferase [Bacteroidales bacterium]
MTSPNQQPRIAVLIPCYNEAQSIGTVVSDFRKVLPEAVIYVYDNNSTDETARVAAAAGAEVRKEPRQGKGNVVRRMFREIDADCYLMVDGDGTYPADAAETLIQPVLDQEADMVIGDRLSTTYFKENKRPLHNAGNKLVRNLINRLWHVDIHDIMTGYRAFSRKFVKLFPVMSEGFEIETEMTIHALDKRFAIVEKPVEYSDRKEGTSKLNTLSDGYKILRIIFSLFKNYRPLLFFGIVAAVLLSVSLILFIPVLVEFFKIGLVPRFPTLITAGFLAIAGLLSLFTGLCLDVIISQHRKDFELKLIAFENENLS